MDGGRALGLRTFDAMEIEVEPGECLSALAITGGRVCGTNSARSERSGVGGRAGRGGAIGVGGTDVVGRAAVGKRDSWSRGETEAECEPPSEPPSEPPCDACDCDPPCEPVDCVPDVRGTCPAPASRSLYGMGGGEAKPGAEAVGRSIGSETERGAAGCIDNRPSSGWRYGSLEEPRGGSSLTQVVGLFGGGEEGEGRDVVGNGLLNSISRGERSRITDVSGVLEEEDRGKDPGQEGREHGRKENGPGVKVLLPGLL